MSEAIYFRLFPYCFAFENKVLTAKQELVERVGYYLLAYTEKESAYLEQLKLSFSIDRLIRDREEQKREIGIGEVAFWPGFGTGEEIGIQTLQSYFAKDFNQIYQHPNIDLLSQAVVTQNQAQNHQIKDALMQVLASIDVKELKFAFELALIDLFAIKSHLSIGAYLCEILGEKSSASTYQENFIKTHALVSNLDQALNACRSGYESLKIKIGARHWTEDLLEIAKIQTMIPQDVIIKLDGNQAFDFESAKGLMICAFAFGIHSIEEPLNPNLYTDPALFFRDLRALSKGYLSSYAYSKYLMKDFYTEIALDESLSVFKIDQIPDEIGIFVLKPMFLGGLISCWDIAKEAYQKGKQICITHSMDSAIGRYSCAYLCEALINEGIGVTAGLSGAELRDGINPLFVQNAHIELNPIKTLS